MVKDTFTIEDMRKAFQAGQQTVNANIGYNAFLGENGIYGQEPMMVLYSKIIETPKLIMIL